jgi:tight adherence protein C
VIALLALACGGVAAMPLVVLARREIVAARLRPLAAAFVVVAPEPRFTRFAGARRDITRNPVVAAIGLVAGVPRRRRRERRLDAVMRRELPVVVDLVAVAVSAGCTPFHAVEHAVRYGPAHIGEALRGVVRGCARGQSFDDALAAMGDAISTLRPLADALRTSARLGAPAAPALGRLAREVRADVRRRAEAKARTVPVRLCFPLVACVLPAFGLLTVVPVLLGGLHP